MHGPKCWAQNLYRIDCLLGQAPMGYSNMNQTPQELYKKREQRVVEAIKLNKPDRVPVIPLFGAFASAYAGSSRRDELYNLEKSYASNLKVTLDFMLDMASAPLTFGS